MKLSLTEYKYSFFNLKLQTVAVVLEEGLSQRVTFLTDDNNLEGIMAFRVEFEEVTGAISTVMELRVFGCAQGI